MSGDPNFEKSISSLLGSSKIVRYGAVTIYRLPNPLVLLASACTRAVFRQLHGLLLPLLRNKTFTL
jgi:hypothetical protein